MYSQKVQLDKPRPKPAEVAPPKLLNSVAGASTFVFLALYPKLLKEE
jgi:hypothetical protein